jgi:hypothetical protein
MNPRALSRAQQPMISVLALIPHSPPAPASAGPQRLPPVLQPLASAAVAKLERATKNASASYWLGWKKSD